MKADRNCSVGLAQARDPVRLGLGKVCLKRTSLRHRSEAELIDMRIPVTDGMSQSPGHEQALAPRVFHLNRHALAPGVLHLNQYAPEQALAPRVNHLNRHALEQVLASRIFHLSRHALEQVFAPRIFHLNHQAIEQALAPDCLFNELRLG